jgi:hypothetical protein
MLLFFGTVREYVPGVEKGVEVQAVAAAAGDAKLSYTIGAIHADPTAIEPSLISRRRSASIDLAAQGMLSTSRIADVSSSTLPPRSEPDPYLRPF